MSALIDVEEQFPTRPLPGERHAEGVSATPSIAAHQQEGWTTWLYRGIATNFVANTMPGIFPGADLLERRLETSVASRINQLLAISLDFHANLRENRIA